MATSYIGVTLHNMYIGTLKTNSLKLLFHEYLSCEDYVWRDQLYSTCTCRSTHFGFKKLTAAFSACLRQ